MATPAAGSEFDHEGRARYLPPEERTTAITVGSASLYICILAAVLSRGPLFDAGGLQLLQLVQFAVVIVAATWLDSILAHFGRDGAADNLIAIMTVAGILGASVAPQAVAKRDQRRALLLTTVSVTVVDL